MAQFLGKGDDNTKMGDVPSTFNQPYGYESENEERPFGSYVGFLDGNLLFTAERAFQFGRCSEDRSGAFLFLKGVYALQREKQTKNGEGKQTLKKLSKRKRNSNVPRSSLHVFTRINGLAGSTAWSWQDLRSRSKRLGKVSYG